MILSYIPKLKFGTHFWSVHVGEDRVFESTCPVSSVPVYPPNYLRKDSTFRCDKRLADKTGQSILEGAGWVTESDVALMCPLEG